MQIGSLFDNRTDRGVKYSYRRRGMDEFYYPDNKKEEQHKEYYTRDNGNLFFKKEVSWNNTVILLDGVDIRVEFDGTCFIDHVSLTQGSSVYDAESDTTYYAETAEIEIFTIEDGEYKKIGSYKPETNKNVTDKDVEIAVGVFCDNVTIRINSNCMPVAVSKLDIWGAWELSDSIWPLPKKAEFSKESFALSTLKTVKATNEDEKFAYEFLNRKFKKITGADLKLSETEGDIEINLSGDNNIDGYKLSAKDGKCIITSHNRRGLLYGVSAMLQLIDSDKVKCCEAETECYMEFRGVHFAIPDKNQVPFLKSMVENVFIPMNYNMAIIEVAAAMRYDKYPEIAEAWTTAIDHYKKGEWPKPAHYGFVSGDIWEKSEVRELCDYLESFGLEIVPEVQSWGHTQYITMAYPHLAEIDINPEEENINLNTKDAVTSSFYHHTMCPNHPDYYKVIFGITDEIIEAMKPKRFLHMGHDEIYQVGKCSICKDIPKGEIFAKEVTTLNDYIKSKKLNMMIWADMLQCMEYSTPAAINYIPKDVIMLDFVWYFHLKKDIEDNLLSHGFKVMMGNMYSSHYPRFEKRAAKEGLIGAQVSAWVPFSEERYAFEGKMFEYIFAATGLCSSDYDSSMRLTYNEIIKPIIKDVRYTIGDLYCEGEEKSVKLNGERKNIPYDIRDIVSYEGAQAINIKNNTADIPVDSYANIITFAHATDRSAKRVMWQTPYQIGAYEIVYEDGTSYIEKITYALNIYRYDSPFGDKIKSPLFRHEGYIGTYLLIPECGKTHSGEDYTIGNYSIKNPYPEKKISKIKARHNKNTDAKIILFDIKLK